MCRAFRSEEAQLEKTLMSAMLWQPSAERISAARVTAFVDRVNRRHGQNLAGMPDLWRWSVASPAAFWAEVWDFCGIIGDGPGSPVVDDIGRMPGARWFPAARLNFAENLLRRTDDGDALVFWGEDRVKRRLSYRQLNRLVASLAAAMRAMGVTAGDRVAALLPNMPETIAGMLAAASIGAIWSSESPDFSVDAALARFGQIAPKLLISCDGYWYGGVRRELGAKLASIVGGLPSLEKLVVVPYLADEPDAPAIPRAVRLDRFIAVDAEDRPVFQRFPFNHPLYIVFTSGTTGAPKCIIHSAGGTLLQHMKEHQLHCDIKAGDRVCYFTTCGWLMWNWLASCLASQATLLLYDGSPHLAGCRVLFDYADAEAMTLLGLPGKVVDAIVKSGVKPAETHCLTDLRTILSAGSVLVPQNFDYVYRHIKRDVCLSSISGGTEILSCFMLGNPAGPGEIQTRGLGMKVEVFDDDGRPVTGKPGELVCSRPFPSMPLGLWDDPRGERYRRAYFSRFPGVWAHGDWVEVTKHDGIVVHGRSATTLDIAGERIGTAEIYGHVEAIGDVVEALAITQDWQGDRRLILFVRLKPGVALDPELIGRIEQCLADNLSPRHVPAKIVQVADIPHTRSGKLVELAVRDVVHGRDVAARDTLANPEALDLFAALPELSD